MTGSVVNNQNDDGVEIPRQRAKLNGKGPVNNAQSGPKTHLGMNLDYWYIDGVAYDFTDFVKRHPGGRWAIGLGKGRECLGMLQSYHLKLDKVYAAMEKYKLPASQNVEVFPPVKRVSFKEDGFFAECKREAADYFEKNNLSHKADWLHVFMFVANVALILYSCFQMVFQQSFLFALLHGVMRAILVVQTTHGASHFSFSMSGTINRWAYRLGTVLIGLWAPPVWDVQHVVAHHVYTNEWPYDSDSAFPLKSIFPNQRRLWFHKYQHIYMWVIYAFTIPLVMWNSFKDIYTGKQVLFRLRYHDITDKYEAWGCSVLSFVYQYFPFLLLPFWTAAAVTLVSSVTSSLFFSLQFVVNHEVDGIIETSPTAQYSGKNPKPESSTMLPPTPPHGVDWGEYQLANSLTFAPGNTLALEMAGGLNTQVEHHMFPGVHYSHYTAMGDIIRRVAKRRGLTYHSRPNLWQALQAHYRLLKNPPPSCRTKGEKGL